MMFFGGGLIVYSYLRGDTRPSVMAGLFSSEEGRLSPIVRQQLFQLENELAAIKIDIKQNQIQAGQLTKEQQQSLVDILKVQFQGAVADEIISKVEQKYTAQITENAQAMPIRTAFAYTRERLLKEISSLTRRNNVNLTIGVVTTVAAVSLLTYLVLGSTEIKFNNVPDLLAHFIPRVSVAAFIEVFSFFFLKLYKSGIQEIKYFQNELTNVDMKVIALESAFLKSPNALTEKIAPQLVGTDRNLAPIIAPTDSGKDAKQVDPKSLLELLDKVVKLVGSNHS